MENRDQRNLANFLRFFINRPHHLAKYLLDNEAINQKFLNSLGNYELSEEKIKEIDLHFLDINQMNNFFNSLISKKKKKENIEDLKSELTMELERCIKEERYEDAIRIRDYLKKLTKDIY